MLKTELIYLYLILYFDFVMLQLAAWEPDRASLPHPVAVTDYMRTFK